MVTAKRMTYTVTGTARISGDTIVPELALPVNALFT